MNASRTAIHRSARRASARGATVVEILAIVAALLALGLLALRFIGTANEATGSRQG